MTTYYVVAFDNLDGYGWHKTARQYHYLCKAADDTLRWEALRTSILLDDNTVLPGSCDDIQHYEDQKIAESVVFQLAVLDNSLVGRLRIMPCPLCPRSLSEKPRDGS